MLAIEELVCWNPECNKCWNERPHRYNMQSEQVNNDVELRRLHMACRVFNCSIVTLPSACSLFHLLLVFFPCCYFFLFFVLIHISHPIGHNSRTFCAKLELITRIYYDVVRFVHICSSIICVLYHWMGRNNSSRVVCSFSALPETTTASTKHL